MSGTRRKVDGDTRFNQERFSSNEAYGSPLLGNLVAKRAGLLKDPEDRALLYFLQQLSHGDGGLERVAADLVEMFPERIGTPSMRKLGFAEGRVYSAEETRTVRGEIPQGYCRFPMRGEEPPIKPPARPGRDRMMEHLGYHDAPAEPAAPPSYPERYPASAFFDAAKAACDDLADHLRRLCVAPEMDLRNDSVAIYPDPAHPLYHHGRRNNDAGVWYFADLIDALRSYRDRSASEAEDEIASTSIAEKIQEDMAFAMEERSLVVIEGLERMGKSAAAKNFCRRNPGKAVYVRLESGTDMATFYRAIARALGTACNAQRKAVEMRTRIEETLCQGDLMLVIDEAHYCFPQARRVHNAPPRMEWVRDMVDEGVPIVLVGTPQFERSCQQHEKQIAWNAGQIRGRVALHTTLPESLSDEDLKRIAAHMLPDASKPTLKRLLAVVDGSDDYVAAIERAVKRARYFARQHGTGQPSSDDVKKAVHEIIPPKQRPESTEQPSEQAVKTLENISRRRLKDPLPSPRRQTSPLSIDRDTTITTTERRAAQTSS